MECWASVSASVAARGVPEVNADLTASLMRALAAPGALSTRTLCLVPGQLCWAVYVDVMVLEAGGNLRDIVSLAAFAALNDARVPIVHVFRGSDEEETTAAAEEEKPKASQGASAGKSVGGAGAPAVAAEGVKEEEEEEVWKAVSFDIEVDDDPTAVEWLTSKASAKDVPITITLSEIGGAVVVDASAEEEACAAGRVEISVRRDGLVTAVHTVSSGSAPGRSLAPAALRRCLEAAGRLAPALFRRVDEALEVARRSERDAARAGAAGGDRDATAGSGGVSMSAGSGGGKVVGALTAPGAGKGPAESSAVAGRLPPSSTASFPSLASTLGGDSTVVATDPSQRVAEGGAGRGAGSAGSGRGGRGRGRGR